MRAASSTSKHRLTADKARAMLEEGVANGRKLTERQRRYFGLIASGKEPTKK